MANNCLTQIIISGSNKSITRLYEKFVDAIEKDDGIRYESIYGNYQHYMNRWLGNLLIYLDIEIKKSDIKCRGYVDDYWLDDKTNEIHIQTDTAWVPMIRVFSKFKNRFASSAKISFCAEEPGCELYWRSDNSWEKYYVDYDCQTDYMEEKDLRRFLINLLGHDGDLDKLITEARDKAGACIYEFQLMDLCEVD